MQKEIIESVLSGCDTLGILPTGGGKSITFQVPGLVKEGVVIIVTPLISLMKDQVDNLKSKKIKAVAIHSGMTFREKNLAREKLFNDKAKFLYISPERLSSDFFIQEIKTLKVSLIVVDEAHCISQWGYDFRPSYLRIKRLRKVFPQVPVLALTASATREVAEDICLQLEFKQEHNVFRASVLRDNLNYIVRPSEGKMYDIGKILSSTSGSSIVYVRSRKRTREIAEYLENSGISASYYHAALDPLLKIERQQKWKEGEIRVMVATNAFGMGIDKPDVRVVIHYDMPPSLEEYYQEAGRAGRDGLTSYAVLLTSPSDKAVLRRRLTLEFPAKDVIKRIYTLVCVFSRLEIGQGYDKTIDFDLEKFCRTFEVSEAVVRPALRILGQAGYVEFIEEYENSSRVIVTVERDELYRIQLADEEHEKVLNAILRNYPGIFVDYVFINEKKLSFLAHLEDRVIYERLSELSKKKIIHYIPRRKTPLLHFPTAMEEERYIMIGKDVYEDRKSILSQRIEAMIAYGFSEVDCRQQQLMAYFGEDASGECGRCDRCRERKGKRKGGSAEKSAAGYVREAFGKYSSGFSETDLREIAGRHTDEAVRQLRCFQSEGKVVYENGIWKLNH